MNWLPDLEQNTHLYIIEKDMWNTTCERNLYVFAMDRKCKHVKQLLWSKLQELFEVGVKAKEAQRGERQKKKSEKNWTYLV